MVQQLTLPENDLEHGSFLRSSSKVYPDATQITLDIDFPEIDTLAEMEKLISEDIIKPLAFILNYTVPFADRIEYNQIRRRFILVKASRLRKVVCGLWTALIIWRLMIKISPNSPETSNGVLSYFVKVSYVFFLLYCGVFFLQLWTRGNTITNIFNKCIDSSGELLLKFQCAPRTRLVFLVAHSSWIFCLTFAFTSHVMGGIVAILNEVSGNSSSSSDSIIFGYENVTDDRYSLNYLSPQYPIVVHALVVAANFLNTFNWMLSFFYIGVWALLFRQLFAIFFWKMNTMNQCGYDVDLPQEIRTFNKIATLVDKYNSFNGLLLLGGAVVCILYISTSIEEAVTGVKNLSQFSLKIHLFMSYVPLIITAIMISEVHRMASKFCDMIKECFNQGRGIKNSRSMETLYGIAIVFHDNTNSEVSFKGYGFFTVTYRFIVTMLSVTITYALVAIQWFPQLKPSAEQ